ncbi:MAG: hypothetical protein V7K40_28340 [Nostoc sp.]|uniref:hypothetical protein n=1 Tax=Nostoc sp. TaxID=1180 RepID=UPI002FFB0BC1
MNSDRLLWKSECDCLAENLKNKAIACCERVERSLCRNPQKQSVDASSACR